MSYTAKSVILDIADGHGDDTFVGLRSIDFWYQGSKIANVNTTDFVAYVTSQYASYDDWEAIDTTKVKTGPGLSRQWYSGIGNITNQRLICVFNSSTTFDQIRVNNAVESGGDTDRGINNVEIWISTDTITSTVYGQAISNSTLIFDSTFDEHTASDVEDEQNLTLIAPDLIVLEDMSLDIETYTSKVEDLTLDLSVYLQSVSDGKLDIAAYLQSLSDGKLDLHTEGDALSDLELDIEAAEYTFDNLDLDLSAYYEDLESLPMDIRTSQMIYQHKKLDLFASLSTLETFSMDMQIASELKNDIPLDLSISDGNVLIDCRLDIHTGDGNKTENICMDISVIKTVPIFKTTYAIHLSSAIKEVS